MKFTKERIMPLAGLLFVPALASAATPPAPITTVQGLVNILCLVFDYMFYGLIALSVVMGVVAAFYYVTAGDNAEKVSRANKMLLYTAIGIAVALLAKGIPLIVASFFSVTSGINSC